MQMLIYLKKCSQMQSEDDEKCGKISHRCYKASVMCFPAEDLEPHLSPADR